MIRDVPTQRNNVQLKDARRSMAEWFLNHAQVEKFFIDESGFRLWIKRNFGR